MSIPPRDYADWVRTMERKLQSAIRSGQSNVVRQLQAEIIRVREDVAAVTDPRTPAAPIEITYSTAVYAADNGRPYSEIVIDFTDVTVATDASAIEIDAYELWGRDETGWNGTGTPPPWKRTDTSGTSSFLSGPYEAGSKWRFRMRALGKNMVKPGNWSAEIVATMAVDTAPPPVPPNPVISQRLGVIYLKWNGKAASGNPMPLDFRRLELAEGPASTPTTIIDENLTEAGEILLGGRPYEEVRYYRWRAVDWSGNASTWSGDVSITVQPLVSGDISGLDTTIQEQTERAESAEAAALQAAADAQAAEAAAATSATNATNAAGTATTAQQNAAAAQAAADASAAEATAAEEAATAARVAAEAAEQKALEVAGLGGGQVWTQATAPPSGAVYRWTGNPRISEAVKEVDGVEVRRNWLADSFEPPNPIWGAWYVNGQQSLTTSASTEQAYVGTTSMKITRSAPYAAGAAQTSAAPGMAAVAGLPWTFRFMLYAPANVAGLTMGAYIRFEGTGGGSKTENFVLVEGWNALSVTHTAGTGANGTINVQITTANTFAQGMSVYADAVSLEPGTGIEDFFDGDTPDDRQNDLWIDIDDGNKPYRWVDGTGWTVSTDQAVIEASEAAIAAEAAAANSASSASAAQTAATNAQNSASASATVANEAQAEAEAAAQAATASQQAAAQAAADADAAAVAAGSSSAAALAAEEAAEAANLAADAARDEVNAYVLAGDTIIVNGNFDAPITTPTLGWPSKTLTYNEASTGTARSGSQVLRATPTTATIAYAYTDWIAGQTDRTYYVEYYIRLREALKTGNSAQQLGVYYSWQMVGGTNSSTSVYQNNGAAAVALSALSTTAWTKVATTYKVTAANVTHVRFGPRIPAVTTAGQNFEIDDFRVVDITHAQAALDAAATAQSTANTANSAAGTAQSTANNALAAANGIADNYFSTDPPSGTAVEGSVWFQVNGTGQVIGQWQQTASPSGGTWTKRDIRSETIANLDVGKLSGGFIDSVHIETETLRVGTNATLADTIAKASSADATVTGWKHPSDTTFIDGGKLYTDSVKALQIDTNDLSADTAFVGSMKAGILTADSVTATVLKSDAITSKHSITGALIQSTATASRGIKLTSTALLGYDSTGATMFNLSATTGKASIVGRIITGASGEVGVGLIPAAESYNGKVAAVFITRDGSFPGSVTAGMWVEDASVSTPMNLNLRGHYGGHVEVVTGHMYVRGSGNRIGNFTNWAIGDSNAAAGNYLPALLVSPSAGVTGYMRLANAPTSSSNANAIIAVSPEGQFYRSTSSLRYKSDVQAWTPRAAVMNLMPRTWVDRVPMDSTKPFTRYYGLIAEEVAEHLPEIITYNDAGQPESVQYDRLAVAILPTLRGLLQKVNAVDARVAALEARASGR